MQPNPYQNRHKNYGATVHHFIIDQNPAMLCVLKNRRPHLQLQLILLCTFLLINGCAKVDLNTEQGRMQHDTNYLLEEKLHDGEAASWKYNDETDKWRNLAVFLTCTEEGALCRYYFTFLVEKGRQSPKVFGRSCRKYKNNWEEINWTVGRDKDQHQRIRARYLELNNLNTNAPAYNYISDYALPSPLLDRVQRAEKQYRLPLREMIDTAAKRQKLNPVLIHSVVKTESDYNPAARSHVGAIGLMQLMPATAKDLGVNPSKPKENLRGGTTYLAQQLKRPGIKGNIALALAAYNAGYGNVRKYGYKVPPYKETKNYVTKVMSLYKSQ